MMNRASLAGTLLALPRRRKRLLAISVDAMLCVWTCWAAIYLRLEAWVPLRDNHWIAVGASVALALPIFIRFGLYRTIFRHTGWPAMLAVVRACLLYGAIYALIFTFVSVPGVPRTIGLLQPTLLFLAIGASRALAHYLLGGNYRRILDEEGAPRVLIYGAGEAGRQLASALNGPGGMKVAGFLDDDPSLHGALILGLPVFDPANVARTVAQEEISDVLLALPPATRRRRRLEIVDLLVSAGANVRALPGLAELAGGKVQISDLRPVQIEDLLGREPVTPDPALLRAKITGRRVLVTGGGGSIGSELCRQIFRLAPEALIVVDSGEFALYSINRELEEQRAKEGLGDLPLVPILCSVQDSARIRAVVDQWRPDTIYHAAAYKHVPLVERNPAEGLKNNVFGTLELARAALELGVKDMVLISTDKAVRPTNVMGASKRLSEMILQAFAAEEPSTCFSMVRFGNVLGSSGSVVPLFRDQIAAGGPVTITHHDVTRYFMTISEAAELVIQASSMATGGDVFVLDMGEPIRIHDLAVSMVELCGLRVRGEGNPEGDIEIAVIGLRPGEKLHEELLIGHDPQPTAHQRIMRAQEEFLPPDRLRAALEELQGMLLRGEEADSLALLRRLVPEFRRSGARRKPSPEPEKAAPATSPAPLANDAEEFPAVTPLVAKGAVGR